MCGNIASKLGGKQRYIYVWQQYDTASCIRGVTSVVCLCPMSRFLLSQKQKTSNALREGNQKRYQIMKMLICTKGFGELTCVMYFVPSASSQ